MNIERDKIIRPCWLVRIYYQCYCLYTYTAAVLYLYTYIITVKESLTLNSALTSDCSVISKSLAILQNMYIQFREFASKIIKLS